MAFSFGGASTGGSTGLSFGSTSSANTAKVQPFSFGGATTTTAASGFNFGSTATAKTTASLFGTTATTSASSGFAGFGGAAKTTASLFGSTAATSAATGFSGFGNTAKSSGGLFGSATTTSAASGFSGFGSAGGGFKLGGTSTAASKPSGFSFGLTGGGTGGLTSAGTQGLSLTSTTTSAQFQGLGGSSVTTNAGNQNIDGNKTNGANQAIKEENVPQELSNDIQEFEKFMKGQKDSSGVVGKFSVRSLTKIREEIATFSYSLGSVSSALHRNTAAVQKLKNDFTQELKNLEMARHTKDLPPSMQHDNIAPIRFFIDMVVEFEGSMQIYRKQIEELENHLNLTEQTSSLTAQDIYQALCKMQDSFISLAANLHSTHDQVKQLKENYLVYRRIVHNDPADIFAENRKKSPKETVAKSSGISPVAQLNNFLALAATVVTIPAQQQGPPQQGFLSTQTAGSSNLFGAPKPTATASLFGSNTATTSSGFGGFNSFGASTTKPLSAGAGFGATNNTSTGLFGASSFNSSAGLTFGGAAAGGSTFELKRPPVGNKRGKK